MALYEVRNGHALSPHAIAAYTRTELATALRSRKPYNVNLLLGGVDVSPPRTAADPDVAAAAPTSKPKLYWIDYLASCVDVPYAAHGYAQYYCLSILDKHHHPGIDLEQGMKLLRMCSEELRRRLPVDFKGMMVKVITAEGVREVEIGDDPTVKSA